jgi:molecular chaperone HtpG
MGQPKTVEFQAEVKQLLDIVIHSLYSEKEIFLRELISNASDALDKRRFLAIEDKTLENPDPMIKLIRDEEGRTLTIVDSGIGMTEEEVVENIGTIARSGTKAFMKQLQEKKENDNPDMIGQFGVGFYSAFIVADKVTMKTRKAGTAKAVVWESTGDGSFTLSEGEMERAGTEIILHLREIDKEADEDDYTQEWVLRGLVKKYSDFITYPVRMDVEKEVEVEGPEKEEGEEQEKAKVTQEETLNSMKAIWMRPKSEVTEEEHKEFYKQLTHDFQDPFETITFSAEGTIEYKSLLYIPTQRPHDIMYRDAKRGLNLYVKQVFIMEHCEKVLPEYLRFVKGLVDSPDFSLNVSRELLQQNRQIVAIKKRLTKKILDTLKSIKDKDKERYLKFWEAFGDVLKEGPATDQENADVVKELLLFKTSKGDGLRSLDEIVEGMPEDQKEIYYITGESVSAVENSPLLEAFHEKGYEVLFLVDQVDEFMMQGLQAFKEKNFKSVNKGDVDLNTEDEKKEAEKKAEEDKKTYGNLLEDLQKKLDEEIKEVRLSNRLKSSAVCLVSDESAMTPQMEAMFKQMGQEVPKAKRIMELNSDHDVVKLLQKIHGENKEDDRVQRFGKLLFNQALLAEGLQIENPVEFAKEVANLMVAANQ